MNAIEKSRQDAIDSVRHSFRIRRYSPRTESVYIPCLGKFFNHFECNPAEITDSQVQSFILSHLTKGISASYQNQFVNAIKYYFEQILRRKKRYYNALRPQRKDALPKVISEERVIEGFLKITNRKHRCICLLLYGCGMRLNEVISCRMSWFNKDRKELRVTGKGNKTRIVPLNDHLLDELRKYYLEYKPKTFLFEGQGNEQYSGTSIQQITKRFFGCNPHTLRHSYATHHLEHGTDLRVIQALLGHKHVKTTEIYTHVSTNLLAKIYSPSEIIQ